MGNLPVACCHGNTTFLFAFHIYLVVSNLTTKEELKQIHSNYFGNPYKRLFLFLTIDLAAQIFLI